MTMDHHEMGKTPVAKRVSFDDIDEDVLETFIKVKSKYITDGQVQYPAESRNVNTSSEKHIASIFCYKLCSSNLCNV